MVSYVTLDASVHHDYNSRTLTAKKSTESYRNTVDSKVTLSMGIVNVERGIDRIETTTKFLLRDIFLSVEVRMLFSVGHHTVLGRIIFFES